MEGPTMLADSIAQLQQLVPQLAADVAAGDQAQAAALAQLTAAKDQLAAAQAVISADEAQLAADQRQHAADLAQHGIDAATIAALQAQIAAGQQQAAPLAGFPKLAWHDEFDGPLDPANWRVDNGVAAGNERAIRWARNVTVANGNLVIQPRLETTTANTKTGPVTRQCTSGSINSVPVFQRPCYIETRVLLPLAAGRSAGMWPAPTWLRAGSGAGEIDTAEFFELGPDATQNAINEAPHAKHTAHIYSDTNSGAGKAGILDTRLIDVAAWHVFGCQIDADGSVTVYRDGAVFKRFPVATYPYLGGAAFTGGYRILTTLQVGSAYYGGPDANTDWSQALRTDYVRVWTP